MKAPLIATARGDRCQRLGSSDGGFGALCKVLQAWRRIEPMRLVSDSWDAYWGRFEAHGLGGIVGHGVVRGTVDGDAVKQLAESRYYTNLLQHERVLRVCSRLVAAAKDEAIGIAVLKGPALLEQAYRDGGLRGYGDVDLFVGSKENALRLLARAGCDYVVDKEVGGLSKRIREPGKIAASCDGVTLELMYPINPQTDPMHTLLVRHSSLLLRVPDDVSVLLDPDPSLHFVFLVLHMGINHMCSRLIWYWDLVMLVETQRERIDPEWIARELEALQIVQLASAIGSVCRSRFDTAVPLPCAEPKWNQPFLRFALAPQVIAERRLDLWQETQPGNVGLRVVYAAGFYLLCDPRSSGVPYAAAQYTRARLERALRIRILPLKNLLSSILVLIAAGCAHLICKGMLFINTPADAIKDARYAIAVKKA